MGSYFRILGGIFCLLNAHVLGAQDLILPPTTPRKQVPIYKSEEQAQEEFEQKRHHIDYQTEKHFPVQEHDALLLRDQQLLKELISEKPMNLGISTGLFYGRALTFGQFRKNYSLDLGARVLFFWSPQADDNKASLRFFTGMRHAFFNGSGTYKELTGRFSFMYFGPMIGLGKLSPAPRSVGQGTLKSRSEIHKALVPRYGYYLLTGVAAQNRQVRVEPQSEDIDEDLSEKAIAFDSPGLWLEFIYAHTLYNALSINACLGAQSGKEKLFIYLGMSVAGWH